MDWIEQETTTGGFCSTKPLKLYCTNATLKPKLHSNQTDVFGDVFGTVVICWHQSAKFFWQGWSSVPEGSTKYSATVFLPLALWEVPHRCFPSNFGITTKPNLEENGENKNTQQTKKYRAKDCFHVSVRSRGSRRQTDGKLLHIRHHQPKPSSNCWLATDLATLKQIHL